MDEVSCGWRQTLDSVQFNQNGPIRNVSEHVAKLFPPIKSTPDCSGQQHWSKFQIVPANQVLGFPIASKMLSTSLLKNNVRYSRARLSLAKVRAWFWRIKNSEGGARCFLFWKCKCNKILRASCSSTSTTTPAEEESFRNHLAGEGVCFGNWIFSCQDRTWTSSLSRFGTAGSQVRYKIQARKYPPGTLFVRFLLPPPSTTLDY